MIQNLFFYCLSKIIENNVSYIKYINISEEKEYNYNNENEYNFMVFVFNDYQKLPENYFVHIYQIKGEVSLYGLKCLNIFNSTNITEINSKLNINNLFNEYKKGNILFPRKVNNNINIYIDSNIDLEKDERYLLIFPVFCQDKNNQCRFSLGAYDLENKNNLNYTLKYNEVFSIKNIVNNYNFMINENNKSRFLIIEISYFHEDIDLHLNTSNIYKFENIYRIILQDINNYVIEFTNIKQNSNYYKIKYYASNFSDSYNIISDNELTKFIIENNNENYSLVYDNSINNISNIFIYIYSANCEFEINQTQKMQIYGEEFDISNKTNISFTIKVPEELDNNCLFYSAAVDLEIEKYIYLQINEKIAFQFTKNIREMSFRHATLYEEGETSNLYLEVIVPPFNEILLNVYIYKGQKHLLFSKKIKKRNIFYISEITKICDPEEECLIFAEISNIFNVDFIENNNYYGTKQNNSNFIYIQYLNNFEREDYMIINKLSQEFSIKNNKKTIYKYLIKKGTIYELFINFDKRPKDFDVFRKTLNVQESIILDKNGRYIIDWNPDFSSEFQYIMVYTYGDSYSSGFTYYLRELNKPLRIISNENVHGYFSEMENNILQYNYTFEEEINSFYLEIFSKNTQIKIEFISKNNIKCSNFFKDFTKLNSSELIKFNCSTKLNNTSTILITFKYSGNMESERHFSFRLLPINIYGNIIYLKESEEAICDPKYRNKYCLFYFNLPENILKGDTVSIYGYYEEIPKNLILFAKQISIRNDLKADDFDDLKEDYEKNSIKGKKLDYLELEIVHKNYKLSYNNYIIGLFETDGKSKIRMVYTLYQPNNYLKDKKKLIISPGDKKYYSFLGKKEEEILEFKYGKYEHNLDFQGLLYLSKINQKLSLSINVEYERKINIEEVIIVELGNSEEENDDDDDDDDDIFISSIFKSLCNFYLQYDILKKNDIFLFHLKKDKPYNIYFIHVRTPIHFYLPIMENNYDLKINFKFEEESYYFYSNDYYLNNFTLYALLVDNYFISKGLYLNYDELNLKDNNKDHYINDLYNIEVLDAERIFLISFNNSNGVKKEKYFKYKYIFISLFYKKNENKDNNLENILL